MISGFFFFFFAVWRIVRFHSLIDVMINTHNGDCGGVSLHPVLLLERSSSFSCRTVVVVAIFLCLEEGREAGKASKIEVNNIILLRRLNIPPSWLLLKYPRHCKMLHQRLDLLYANCILPVMCSCWRWCFLFVLAHLRLAQVSELVWLGMTNPG